MQESFTTSGNYCASISYEPEKSRVHCFVHGVPSFEQEKFFSQVIASRQFACLPMFVPYLLLMAREVSANDKILVCYRQIFNTESLTGHKPGWNGEEPFHLTMENRLRHYVDLDLDQVTRDMTSVATRLSYCEYVCEEHLPSLDKIDEINRMAVAAIDSRSSRRTRLEGLEGRFRLEVNFLRHSLRSIHCRAKYLSKRSQAQVQTVRALLSPPLFPPFPPLE